MKIYKKTTPYSVTDLCVELCGPYAKGIDTSVYVFCENRSTLSYESALAEKYGGTFSVNVTAFSRYMYVKGGDVNRINAASSALVIARSMIANGSRLLRLKNFSSSAASAVYEVIAQLKAAKVSVDDLKKVAESDDGALFFKLKDIALLYEEYEIFLKENGLKDDGDALAGLPSIIRGDADIKGKKAIVAGISNFTALSLDAIRALDEVCDLDCVILSYDGASAVNETLDKLLAIDPAAEVVEDDRVYSPAVTQIKERLYAPELLSEKGMTPGDVVKVAEAADPYDEAAFVASVIKKMINDGYRYRDFCVACPDVDGYLPIIDKAFKERDLPVYADKKEKLSAHPAAALVFSIIDAKRLNLRKDAAMSIVKNPLAFSVEEGDAFEDYVIENALSDYSIRKCFSEKAAEDVRKKLVECKQKMPDNGTIGQFIGVIEDIFGILSVKDKSDALADSLTAAGEGVKAEFVRTGFNKLTEAFYDIKALFGEEAVSVKEFRELLSSAFAASEISLLPRYNDVVFLGDYKSAGIRRSKVLFCIGMTSATPFIKGDNSILNDKDLTRLDGLKVRIEPKISIVNKRERECVVTTMMSFEERLFATYPRVSVGGEKAMRSQAVDYLIAAFTGKDGSPLEILPEKEYLLRSQNADDYIALGAGLADYYEALEKYGEHRLDDLTAAATFLSVVKEKYPEEYSAVVGADGEKAKATYCGSLSSSMIETYYSCPYRAFGEKVLKIKEGKTDEIKQNEFGRIIHATLERFAPSACDAKDEEEAEKIAAKFFDEVVGSDEFGKYRSGAGNAFMLDEVKKEALKECSALYGLGKRSKFRVEGTELRFGGERGAAMKPITLIVNGKKRNVSGYIDRIDVMKSSSGKTYAHVIDYKTGSDVDKMVRPEKLFTGEKLQLYLYLAAVVANGYKAAGAHYLALNDDYSDGKKKKIFFGTAVDDSEVVCGLDDNVEKIGESEEYGIGGRSSSLVDEQTLDDLTEYSLRLAKNCAEEAEKDGFVVSPKENACSYCSLKGACGFDKDDTKNMREPVSVDINDIIAAVQKARKDDE